MHIVGTKFKGLKIVQQKKFQDSRGSLRETFRKKIVKWDDLIFDYGTNLFNIKNLIILLTPSFVLKKLMWYHLD